MNSINGCAMITALWILSTLLLLLQWLCWQNSLCKTHVGGSVVTSAKRQLKSSTSISTLISVIRIPVRRQRRSWLASAASPFHRFVLIIISLQQMTVVYIDWFCGCGSQDKAFWCTNVNMVRHQRTCVTNYVNQQTLKPDEDYVLPHLFSLSYPTFSARAVTRHFGHYNCYYI